MIYIYILYIYIHIIIPSPVHIRHPVHEIMTDPREEHLVGILQGRDVRHAEIRSSVGGETTKNKK